MEAARTDEPMAEDAIVGRSVGVASTRAVFGNHTVIRNGGVSPVPGESSKQESLLDSIERQQSQDIISVDHAIQVQSRMFRKAILEGFDDRRNYTPWGQPTEPWTKKQNELIAGECERFVWLCE